MDTSPEDDFYTQSSTSERTSLRSSIADYVYENGRHCPPTTRASTGVDGCDGRFVCCAEIQFKRFR